MDHILSRPDRVDLGGGRVLRLLSAFEVLEAQREAEELNRRMGLRDRALCNNACLLAKALEKEDRQPMFPGGGAVLEGLTPEEIEALSARWDQFRRSVNPGLDLDDEGLENVKKNSVPTERTACAGGC